MWPLIALALFAQDSAPPSDGGDGAGAAGVVIGLLTAGVSAVITLWSFLSKRKAERETETLRNRKEVQVLTQEEQENAVKAAWAQAKQQALQHKQDLAALNEQLKFHRQELHDLRKSEREWYTKAMVQAETIRFQTAEIEDLRAEIEDLKNEMSRRGVRDRSDEHRPLGSGGGKKDGED